MEVGEQTQRRIARRGDVAGGLERGEEHRVAPLDLVLAQRALQRVDRRVPVLPVGVGDGGEQQRIVVVGSQLQHLPDVLERFRVLPAGEGDLGEREPGLDGPRLLAELTAGGRFRRRVVARAQRAPRRPLLGIDDRCCESDPIPAGRVGVVADQIVQ